MLNRYGMLPDTTDKKALRQRFLSKRQSLPDEDSRNASEAVCARFLESIPLNEGAIIGLYHPIRGEISPMPLLIPLIERGVRCTLPKVEQSRLSYYDFLPDTPLLTSRLGIAEPDASIPRTPDMLIIPLLAFDAAGHRLGYGGGFFDRLGSDPTYANAQRIGFAYDWQEIPALPSEAHDVRLHAVMTDQRYLTFSL